MLIGAGAFVYGAAKRTEAANAARALGVVPAEAEERIRKLRTALKAHVEALSDTRLQLRSLAKAHIATKSELEASEAARLSEQQARAQERAHLSSQIRALTRAVDAERERARVENASLEARLDDGIEREREKELRIAVLEARLQELKKGENAQ